MKLKTGTIYFVSAPGRIKIGFTTKPEQRLRELQGFDMEKLTVIATVPGTRKGELKLHHMIPELRLKGEWFEDCAEVRTLIDDVVSGKIEVDIRPEPEMGVIEHGAGIRERALKQIELLGQEIMDRAEKGESVSDLVRFMIYLGEHVAFAQFTTLELLEDAHLRYRATSNHNQPHKIHDA